MRRVIVHNSLTLDGVMQAPGRPDEDIRGGFKHGGWAQPYFDPVMAEGMNKNAAMLFGRRTYQDFATVWPPQKNDNPFAAALNNAPKYVASRTLKEPLAWSHSALLKGDAADAVARLKKQAGPDLVILGSGDLIQSLMERNLIDQYVLLIHPLVLGSGRHMFTNGGPLATLRLVDTKPTKTGVVIATYEPGKRPAANTSKPPTAKTRPTKPATARAKTAKK
jgi:dihydrofolate reductase